MKKFFPNIETAIIFVFILCVILWGVTRCNRKREDLAIRSVTAGVIGTALPDTISTASPAARNAAPISPTTTPAVAPPPPTVTPNQGVVTVPPPTVPNPTQVTPNSTTNPTVRPNTNTTIPVTATIPTKSPTITPTPIEAGGTALYVLIDGLNVRTKPDLKAKSLGKLKLNDQVYFMNEVTPEAQTIRLADKTEVTKPWFKIKTKRGTIGWVHGSGIDFYKRKPQVD